MTSVKGRAEGDSRVLYEIISTVASSLELDEVLDAVVRLLSEASAVHACFVYLLDDSGERLVLKASSGPYAHLVDRITLEKGEGLAWWALERREPGFIRENALADPRTKYVPELEEERFQSLLSVPILA
ncbi:MAG: GAF domain-containing protein, partial [Actinobacteria bacterium]|nr:GAF domain-containing protein [Actinomycetota bacterium]